MSRLGGALRKAYEVSPETVKRAAGGVMRLLPERMLYGAAYERTLRLLVESERWSADQHRARQIEQVRDLLRMAGQTVPYYRQLFRELGFDPAGIACLDDLQGLPLLTRDMVRELGSALVPEGTPASAYKLSDHRGHIGPAAGLPYCSRCVSRGVRIMTSQWARVGYRRGSRRVVVAGTRHQGARTGKLWEYDPSDFRVALLKLRPESREPGPDGRADAAIQAGVLARVSVFTGPFLQVILSARPGVADAQVPAARFGELRHVAAGVRRKGLRGQGLYVVWALQEVHSRRQVRTRRSVSPFCPSTA